MRVKRKIYIYYNNCLSFKMPFTWNLPHGPLPLFFGWPRSSSFFSLSPLPPFLVTIDIDVISRARTSHHCAFSFSVNLNIIDLNFFLYIFTLYPCATSANQRGSRSFRPNFKGLFGHWNTSSAVYVASLIRLNDPYKVEGVDDLSNPFAHPSTVFFLLAWESRK